MFLVGPLVGISTLASTKAVGNGGDTGAVGVCTMASTTGCGAGDVEELAGIGGAVDGGGGGAGCGSTGSGSAGTIAERACSSVSMAQET